MFPSHLTHARRRRHALLAAPIALIAGLALTGSVLATGSVLVSESFTNATTNSNNWDLPTAPGGTNVACLTASSNASQTPIPGCALSTPDAAGSGTLRLTSADGALEGGVAYGQTLPTTEGLDVTFNSYQYGGNGADGIGFFLAAVNPSSPTTPTNIGQPGGDLGYASGTADGLADGYLGIGLDSWGNYSNNVADGSGCTDPSWVGVGVQVPGQVTVRGPGNNAVGYCPLASTASSDGGIAQTLHGTTRADSQVPVEVVVNPGTSSVLTSSGLTVAAGRYEVAFTPIGGSQEIVSGALPTTGNGELPSGTIPSAWINPSTGLPYQLAMGWVASTGGAVDIHEVDSASVETLSGSLPELSGDLSAGTPEATGLTQTYVLHVATVAGQGAETQSVIVSDTFPSSVEPKSGAGGTGWSCTVSGQTDTCTYAVTGSLAAGTSLPALSMPVTVLAVAGTTITDPATIHSNDVLPFTVSASSVVPVATVTTTVPVPSTGAGALSLMSMVAGLALLLAGAALALVGLGGGPTTRRRAGSRV